MHVIKRINNNVVLVAEGGTRMIVIGKGLGFKVHPGDMVDGRLVEQRYVLQKGDNEAYYVELLRETSPELLSLSRNVVALAEARLEAELPANLVFTLADHIGFTAERLRRGLAISHPLAWEIRQFYPAEHQAGLDALGLIERSLGIRVPEAEAAFLAMHFVNALGSLGGRFDAADLASAMVEVVSIVEAHYKRPVDQASISFSRFIAHLRYCLARRLTQEPADEDAANGELAAIVAQKYPEAHACARKIIAYLEQAQPASAEQTNVGSQNELLYLTLHVNRLAASQQGDTTHG